MIDLAVSGRFEGVAQPTGTHRSAARLFAALKCQSALTLEVCSPIKRASSSRLVTRVASEHIWEQLVFPYETKANALLSLLGTGPIVHSRKKHCMVVHDLNYLLLPRVFGRAFRTWYRFACGLAAQRADVVVCFTNYVSGTIQKRLGIPADRIRVIPQGPGLTGLDKPLEGPRPQTPTRPYFLCVGSLQPHKNLARVLAAWEMFSQKHGSYSLKVVGRAQGNFASLGLDLSKLPREVGFTGYLSDKELIDLYRGATGFLYPSIEEGFGLPVVEAFYCGCPVITSNRSCLPEVAGGAALCVDPTKHQDIAEAMHALVSRAGLAAELQALGYRQATSYNWENAGHALDRIVSELIP